MIDTSSKNKVIAKNTLLLYVRMLLLMAVSLYTSRVVLATLGVEDYGIYNVVGSIVSMFTFISLAMGNATNRFITYALGKGDQQELKEVVGASFVIHGALAFLILILAETFGLWFLHYKMVIPERRMYAAEWVFQFSIIACMVSIITVPFNAMIIAHEKMGAFAIISILDATMKLLIVYLIQIARYDKLIFYAGLILFVNILDILFYRLYCAKHFHEAQKIKFTTKFSQFKEMKSFVGWSMMGNLASIGYTQGLNLLLNVFFGPAVNAARGVAVQVQEAVKRFVKNFQTAVNPQIVKFYASGDYERLHFLVYSSSKFSFFLLYTMVLPIALEADTILGLWLREVPDGAVLFTILTLLILLVDPLSNPIDTANQATGNIRIYQILEGGSLLLILPVAYFVLKAGGHPYSVFVVQLVIMYIVQPIRLFLVCHKIKMSKRVYVKRVLAPVFYVAITSLILPLTAHYLLPHSFGSFISTVLVSVISVLVCSYCLGLTKSERQLIIHKVKGLLEKTSLL